MQQSTLFRWTGNTLIATRMGHIPINRLKIGDLVWTLGQENNRIQAPIIKIGKQRLEGKKSNTYEILPQGTGVYWVNQKMVKSLLWSKKKSFILSHMLKSKFFRFSQKSLSLVLLKPLHLTHH